MKKTLLLSAFLSSALLAGTKLYEISPMVGYNITEGNVGLKDHYLGGLEMQYNAPDFIIAPEISLYYSPKAKYKGANPVPNDTGIFRGALNGVYTFETQGALSPFVKAGLGYENVSDEIPSNDSGLFADAGAGVKYSLTQNLALKVEAIYLAKFSAHNSTADSNLMTLVGLSYAFGEGAQKEPESAVVDGDDDNDGVKNSIDQCPTTAEGVKVDENGCALDSDRDGVLDGDDKCPDTKLGTEVGVDGCELDSDHDGVFNSQDICPNTPAGAKVNSDGCPEGIKLSITFDYDSAVIKPESEPYLNKYADFLTTYTNYRAHIVGYTDSRGSVKHNQKLSERRAKAVMQALIERGVDPKRLSYEGKGEADPVASNDTAEGRAQNRRIEAELIRQ